MIACNVALIRRPIPKVFQDLEQPENGIAHIVGSRVGKLLQFADPALAFAVDHELQVRPPGEPLGDRALGTTGDHGMYSMAASAMSESSKRAALACGPFDFSARETYQILTRSFGAR